MADRAEIELLIAAQVDRALVGLASFERSLANIERQHVVTGQQAEVHGQKVEAFTAKMSALANVGNAFVAWQVIERVMGSFKGLEQFNTDLLHTTDLLGGNAQAASTWSAIANIMGISVETVDKAFVKLSTNMNSGSSPALKQMGIEAEGAGGKLRPVNDVLNQAADYFRAHAGASNNAALANELFGKSGYQLLPILQQGSAGLAAFTAEARKYGLILDAETIQRNAAFTFQLKEAEMATRGLAISIGNALLPGISALGLGLSRAISENLPAFIAGIQRAMSYAVGFAEAFLGVDLQVSAAAKQLSEMSGAAVDTGEAMDKGGSSAAAFAERERQVRDAARDATAAIDDQVRALNAQTSATQFADKQKNLAESVAAKEKDIERLRQDQYRDFWLGNFQNAVRVGDQIVTAKQQEEDLKLQITRSSEDNATKLKIAGLETQKRGIADAAQTQIEALQRAAAAGSAAVGGMAAGFAPTVSAGSRAAADQFKFAMDKAAEDTGRSMGAKLQDAIWGKEIQYSDEKGRGLVRAGGGDFLKMGEAIGEAIGTGITTAVGRKMNAYWKAKFTPGVFGGTGGGFDPSIFEDRGLAQLTFARGGRVPGYEGEERIAKVHGGEMVLNREQQKQVGPDMRGIEHRLDQLIALVAGGQGSGGSGSDAMLSELIERVANSRRRGMVGAYAR